MTTDETKSDVEEGFAAKNVMSLTQKKNNEIMRVTLFLNGLYDDALLCCIFYECIYLLMVSFL